MAGKNIVMGEMSYEEIKDSIAKGFVNVVIPAGAAESHGPHLPTGTDVIMAEFIGKKIAERLPLTLVAPVIPLGPAELLRNFPGTISLRPYIFTEILSDYCRAISKAGFKTMFIISYHGGNYAPIKDAVPLLSQQFPELNVVGLVGPFIGYRQARDKIIAKYNVSPEEAGNHAGAVETSHMMFVRPDLVRMDRARRGLVNPEIPDMSSNVIAMMKGYDQLDKTGVHGDPTKANKEMGELTCEALIASWTSDCEKALEYLSKR
jgi:creatinine amidohydrolase